jgi:hypothetical protein
MDLLASLLVGNTHAILLVAVAFFAGHLALRSLWRGLVLLRTPFAFGHRGDAAPHHFGDHTQANSCYYVMPYHAE